MKIIFVIFFVYFLSGLNAQASAETIYLKNGRKLIGKIIEKNEQQVKVDVGGVSLTYFPDEIDRIEETPSPSAQAAVPKPVSPDLRPWLPQKPSPFQNEPQRRDAEPTAVAVPPPDPLAGLNKQQLIWKLIEVSGTRVSMQKIFDQMISQAPAEQIDQIKAMFNIDEILLQVVPIYDSYFSDKELRDLVNFYTSDSGRKLLEVTPAITQESMEKTLNYFQRKMQETPLQAP